MIYEPWRVGQHYGIHVYAGERPVATFHDPADAQRAVDAVNETAIAAQWAYQRGYEDGQAAATTS